MGRFDDASIRTTAMVQPDLCRLMSGERRTDDRDVFYRETFLTSAKHSCTLCPCRHKIVELCNRLF